MNLRVAALAVLLFLPVTVLAYGDTVWLRTFDPGNVAGQQAANCLSIDADGNPVAAGPYNGWGGGDDFATVKFTPTGETLWARRCGTARIEKPNALTLDNTGNIVVTGSGYDSSPQRQCGLTVKYSPDGHEEWAMRWRRSDDFSVTLFDVACDRDGNVYVVGTVEDGNYQNDMLTVKYNSAGVEQWFRTFDCSPGYGQADVGRGVAVDSSGMVLVAGASQYWQAYKGDISLFKYSPTGGEVWHQRFELPDSASSGTGRLRVAPDGGFYVEASAADHGSPTEYAVHKFSSGGVHEWTFRYGASTSGNDYLSAMAIDDSGYVYMTGNSTDEGAVDYATFKVSPAGDSIWCARYDASTNANADLCLGPHDEIYITGVSDDTGGTHRIATVKYNNQGSEQWAVRTGSGSDVTNRIARGPDGGIYVCGGSQTTTGRDFMVMKYMEYNPGHDVGCINIPSPHGAVASGTVVVPACSLYNFGTFPESYRVRMRIGTAYEETTYVADHQPATARCATFPNWIAGPVGTHAVLGSTELAVDSNPANDVCLDSVTVGPPGIEESTLASDRPDKFTATLVSRILSLPGPPCAAHGALLSVDGRKVLDLTSGPNDVSRLAPGIYFIHEEPSAANRAASTIRRVMIFK